MDVITTHINADFDCLGSMVAAARLYPGALLSFPGSQEKGLRDFIAHHPDYLPLFTRAKDIDLDAITRLIVVDCQQAARIGRFASILSRPGLEVHVYDHHRFWRTVSGSPAVWSDLAVPYQLFWAAWRGSEV